MAQRARLIFVSLALVGTIGYGIVRVQSSSFQPGPRIAMLQTNDVNEFNSDVTRKPENLQTDLEALMARPERFASTRPRRLARDRESLELLPDRPRLDLKALDALIKKEYDPQDLGERWLANRDAIQTHFARLMQVFPIPMIVGSSIYELKPDSYLKFNAAILFRPGLENQYYHKLHLVPFGEYVPLLETFPWLIRLTPYRGTRLHFLDHGKEPTWFEFGSYRLATAICFEDTLPHVVRRFFAEAPDGRQPDILVNLSNDGWFKETSEHEMHLAVSIFRCIENRVPLVRSVNTGISAVVDGNGRIINSLGKLKRGVLIDTIPLDGRVSLYSQWGDWLGLSCLAMMIGLLVLGTFSPRRPRSMTPVPTG